MFFNLNLYSIFQEAMNIRKFCFFFFLYSLPYYVTAQGNSVCECWQPRNPTFSVVQFDGTGANGGPGFPPDYRNDDWSTNIFTIPFSFCFYGTNYSQIFINNNGNISFGSAYETFTANPFPDAAYSMVAPFWGDVDTRDFGSGLVYYKITPNYLIVQWDSVGYYNEHSDKINTFQLIISNGLDPIVPNGNNVSFCYKDMQWTTGDASSGINGFGGEPATVGANKGDGINYIQFARFDKAGNAFDGAFGNADGIDWLDNQNIIFNTCNSSNIAPVVTDFSICEADTVVVCENEILTLSVSFQSPESNQTTTATASAPGVNGFSIVSNTSGNTAIIVTQLVGSPTNLGYNTITYSATDNGNPVQTTSFDLVLFVDTAPDVSVNPDVISICSSAQVPLSAFGATTYSWSPSTGLSSVSGASVIATPSVTTTYMVIGMADNGCKDTAYSTINIGSLQTDIFPESPIICKGDSIQLLAIGGISHSWSPSSGLNTTNDDSVYASPAITSTYYLTADSSGCIGTDSVTIIVNDLPQINISPLNPGICIGDSISLFASGANTYVWSPSTGLNTVVGDTVSANPQSATTYYALGNLMGCYGTDSIMVTVYSLPTVSISPVNPVICKDDTALLFANGANIYFWSPTVNISDTTGDSVFVFPTDTFSYKVFGLDLNGCSGSDSVTITVNFNSLANAGPDKGFCNGDSGIIGSEMIPGCTYLWSPFPGLKTIDSSFSSVSISNFSNNISTQLYFLTVIKNNCPDTDTVAVSIYPHPVAICEILPEKAGIGSLVSFISNSINGDQCVWYSGNGDSLSGCATSYSYSKEGIYEIKLSAFSQYGCFSDTTCSAEITGFSYYIPNTFTPDGDGKNDYFSVIGRNILNFKMLIFDRWGNIIFQTDNIENRWNGKINNKPAKQDVYVYKMEFSDIYDNKYEPIGKVTLLR